MPPTLPNTPDRDRLLDAWRGISVLLVILGHLVTSRFRDALSGLAGRVGQAGAADPAGADPGALRALFTIVEGTGALGVRFFFVISGYIITKLLLEEFNRYGRISLPAFYVRRAARILPALWLYLGFAMLMDAAGQIALRPGSVAWSAAFLCNTSIADCDWFTGHLWSLAVEEQFYLVWPVVLLAAPHLAASAALVAAAVMLLLAQIGALHAGWISNGLNFACIAVGALYAAAPGFRARIERLSLPAVLIAVAALLLVRPGLPHFVAGQARLLNLVTPFLICLLIFGSWKYRHRLEGSRLVGGLAKVGTISYGLYLWQQLFLAAPGAYLGDALRNSVPLFVALALLSWAGVERPLQRIGARISRQLQERSRPPG